MLLARPLHAVLGAGSETKGYYPRPPNGLSAHTNFLNRHNDTLLRVVDFRVKLLRSLLIKCQEFSVDLKGFVFLA